MLNFEYLCLIRIAFKSRIATPKYELPCNEKEMPMIDKTQATIAVIT